MPKKETLSKIIQDTKHLLSFQQSLGIDAYPATDGIKRFLQPSATKKITAHLPQQNSQSSYQKKIINKAVADIPAPPFLRISDIRKELGDCTRCPLHKNRSSILFGSGSTQARLMLIGEWPTRGDDQSGAIFSGQDGEMLDKMLNNVLKLERKEIYISSVIKCLGLEKDPSREEINTCLPFLVAQIKAINPAIIMTMGPTVAQILLKSNKPLIRLRGHFHDFNNIPLMPTFHPAYLIKNPEMKKAVFLDLKMVAQKLAL